MTGCNCKTKIFWFHFQICAHTDYISFPGKFVFANPETDEMKDLSWRFYIEVNHLLQTISP
jgi:hypothetical protein